MRSGPFWIGLTLAFVLVTLGAFGSAPRSAQAIPGDVCAIYTWDATGTALHDGDLVGGDGLVYVLYRVEDDAFGYVNDFFDVVVEELIDEVLVQEIEALEAAIEAEQLAIQPEVDALLAEIALLEAQIALGGDAGEIALLNAEVVQLQADLLELQAHVFALEGEKAALEEVLRELEEALLLFRDTDMVQIDSQTGSARITSKMEITGFEFVKPRADHMLVIPGVGTQRVDHVFPEWFADSDGNDLDSIRAWLLAETGVQPPSEVTDATSICGDAGTQDGWGFVDVTCISSGSFHVKVIPDRERSELTTGIRSLVCPGDAETAEISASPSSLETEPVGSNTDKSLITVAVRDRAGKRIDGAAVTFITNNCTFTNPNAGVDGDFGASPAGLGSTVTVWSDTDSAADHSFLSNQLEEGYAGTAELTLDCSNGTPGLATVTAYVLRPGANIVLETTVVVVGPTAPGGITLTLTPTALTCGDTLVATALAVDANGALVSDGTIIRFTTDTSTGVVGGIEGGQGSNTTINGESTVTVAMSPDDPGMHTVIAWTVDEAGALLTQTSELFECSLAGEAVAGVTQIQGSQALNLITPPSTGDGGLAATGGGMSLAVLAGAAALIGIFVGLTANLREFNFNGRRR